MLRTRIILVLLTAAISAGLFYLPKVVLENDTPAGPVQDTTANAEAAVEEELAPGHQPLDPRERAELNRLRNLFFSKKSAIFADSLAERFQKAGISDSSAFFAGEAVRLEPTRMRLMKAGDTYYEAYTLALNRNSQQEYARKARGFFEQLLQEDPANLEAKAKMAMTYLSESNPMQGILLLREVLKTDPENALALYNLGMLSVQSNQFELAVERLEKLVSLQPSNTQAYLLLGYAHMKAGNSVKARDAFEKVKLLDNDPAVQSTVDSYLKDLK